MKWEDILNVGISSDYNGQTLTDIDCPECGRKIYLDERVILTSNPAKYSYWCPCGWHGSAHVKWRDHV